MRFTLTRGKFHVAGYARDGDSVRFEPRDPQLVAASRGSPPRSNAREHVQLRIEAIDTLETHFSPIGGGTYDQPTTFAHAALDRLLDFTRVRDVVWNAAHTLVVSADESRADGYILARSVEKYGRPVAFVFAGDPPEADGASMHLGAATYYEARFHDLRDAMTAARGAS